jgi:hypothetical protein
MESEKTPISFTRAVELRDVGDARIVVADIESLRLFADFGHQAEVRRPGMRAISAR